MENAKKTGQLHKCNRKEKASRQTGIEFMRILACLMVFAIHVGLPDWYAAHVKETGPVFLGCLIADAVGIFFLVTGCFLAQEYSYRKRLGGLIFRIVIPLLLYTAFSFFFYGLIVSGSTLQESVSHSPEEIKALFMSIPEWSTPPVGAAWHLWFLYTYILVILISPLLKWLCNRMDSSRAIEGAVLAIALIIFIVNDLSLNRFMKVALTGGYALLPAVLFILTGHVLYRHKESFISGKAFAGSALVLLADEVLRTGGILRIYSLGIQNPTPGYWYSSFGLVGTVCIFIIVENLFHNVRAEQPVGKAIISLASYTFPVYILSQFVIDFLINKGMQDFLEQTLSLLHQTTVVIALYRLLASLCAFAVTLLIAVLLRAGRKLLFR